MIKTIVFDVGNVIWEFRPMFDELFNIWGGIIGKNYDDFMDEYKKVYRGFEIDTLTVNQWSKTLAPDLSPEVFESSITKVFDDPEKTAQYLDNNTISLIKKLRKLGYQVGCLSNTENYVYPFYQKNIEPLFDYSILSWKEKLRKPETEIYHQIFKHGNWTPDETLFIDDKLENIEAAAKIGINGLLFINSSNLDLKLKELLNNYE